MSEILRTTRRLELTQIIALGDSKTTGIREITSARGSPELLAGYMRRADEHGAIDRLPGVNDYENLTIVTGVYTKGPAVELPFQRLRQAGFPESIEEEFIVRAVE